MKRRLVMMLTAVMITSLTACGSPSGDTNVNDQESKVEDTVVPMSIYQTFQDFISAMRELPLNDLAKSLGVTDVVINEYLDGITLQDVIDRQRERYVNDYII